MIPDVLHTLEKPDLFEKFKTQTLKDFELAGALQHAPVFLSNNLPELQIEFYNSIIKLENSNALKIVLYRIDITEQQIKQALQVQATVTLHHIMAELMIKRILQKVILKQMYSK